MKKLLFGIVLLLGCVLISCAQDKKSDPPIGDRPNTGKMNIREDAFSSIEPSNLPIAVQKAVEMNYASATIKAASVNAVGQYRLEVVLKDDRSGTLYLDKDGNWIEK